MKTSAPALLLLAFFSASTAALAAPTPVQMDDVREAVFRALFTHARTVMPKAKVYILEKDGYYPPAWGNGTWDPSAALMQRFAGHVPPVATLTQAGGGSSETETWYEIKVHERGLVLQIVSLNWLSETSVEAETYTDIGLPHPAVSVPYRVDFQEGRWAAREDVRQEWWQAVHEGDVREAVVRYELTQGVYGIKPGKAPCYLSFGGYTTALIDDPPDTFMERFAGDPVQLRKASACPKYKKGSFWLMFGIQDVRWVSDKEAEVDGGGTHSQSMSADSIVYDVTRIGDGWKVQPTLEISI